MTAPALPTGTVTFLLTDVVGSVPLWERDASAMHDALVLHDRLMADVVAAAGGVLVRPRGEGDSTFNVFVDPVGAAVAAAEALRALAAAAWPTATPIVVRMAIHRGDAIGRDGDYYGSTVNRAARLRGIAGGGQCLVSAAATEAIDGRLPDGCTLVALGTRKLRGMAEPETVYELMTGARHPDLGAAVGAESVLPQPPLPERLEAGRDPMFVGRGDEQAALDALGAAAAAGDLRCGLVAGEPGIGKTSLVARLAAEMHTAGSAVLFGRCLEDSGVSFAPWVEALDRAVADIGDPLLDGLPPSVTAELARVVPAVAERRPDAVGAPVDPETQGYLLYAAVTNTLAALAADRRVLVVLDDLHWADEPTLHLLHHVVARGQGSILVVGTYRDRETDPHGPLAALLSDLGRDPRFARIALSGLDIRDLRTLVESTAGHSLDPAALAFVDTLHRETQGNPYFAREVLRHLVETGSLGQDDAGRWTTTVDDIAALIPDGVRDLVARRVGRLEPSVQDALTAASVIGTTFDIETLSRTVGTDVDGVLDALESAEAARLVAAVDYDHFEFEHALVAHTLYSALSPPRRARMHRRVAEAIEVIGVADDRAGELALHWSRAHPPAPERAVAAAVRAGDVALEARAAADALRWFDAALEWDAGAPDGPGRAALLVRRGVALRRAGDAGASRALLDAAEEAMVTGDRVSLVRAAVENNRRFAATVGSVDDARVTVLEAALAEVGEEDSPERARLLATLATELEYEASTRRRVLAEEAVAVARRVGDPGTLANVLTSFASAVWDVTTIAERTAASAEALAIAEAVGDPTAAFWAATQAGIAHIESVRFAEFVECMDRKAAVAAELEDPLLQWLAQWQESYRRLLAGDTAGAEAAALAAYEIGSAAGYPDAFLILGAQILAVRSQEGRRGELVDATAAALAAAPGVVGFRAALALGYLEAGRDEEGHDLLDQAAADGFAIPQHSLWLTSVVIWAQAAARADHPGSARLYELLAPYPRLAAFGGSSVIGTTACSLGALARVNGDAVAAARHFADAIELAEALASPFFVAETETEWCRLLVETGDRASAAPRAERARALARAHGFGGIERDLDRLGC